MPVGNKDEAYTIIQNGAQVFDDRFATLKYKRQLERTKMETDKLISLNLNNINNINIIDESPVRGGNLEIPEDGP